MKILSCLLVLMSAPLMAKSSSIVFEGKPHAAIIVDSRADEIFHFPERNKEPFSTASAAKELANYLREISGADVPVEKVSPEEIKKTIEQIKAKGWTPIVVGSAASAQIGALDEAGKAALADPSGFVLVSGSDGIAILGGTPAGTTFGVYELLEQMGVRWFFPGEWGTVVPKQKTISIPPQRLVEKPSLAARYFPVPDAADWMKHQRMGGLYFPPAHGIPLGKGVTVETNPELFSLNKGVRTKRQVCVSNPEVVRRAAEEMRAFFRKKPDAPWIGMGPNDGSGFCECNDCRALDAGDWDAFSHEESVTDRYIWFFNQVLEATKDEFPDKMIAFYIYHTYMRPPVKTKPDARIAGAIAPIGICRVHGVNNPICPERDYLLKLVPEWGKQLPNLYERGYWFNLADPGMLFSQIHRLKEEIPFYHANGAKGFRVECLGHWAVEGPSLYVAGKLLWDVKADTDGLLKDFCEKLFGPAAAPMLAYFQAIEQRLATADYHAGSAFEVARIFPADFRQSLGRQIDLAQKLATHSPFKERVALFSQGYEFCDQLASMVEAQNRQEWKVASEHLERLDQLHTRLLSYEPAMLHKVASPAYSKRFFRLPVEQGAARVSNGNKPVALLSNRWDFLADPLGVGADLGYERPEVRGGNWQSIDATTTWSENGLRYYKGLSWYRQRVAIPESAAGKRLFLWFGGADEAARVWVNGKLVGNSPSSSFTPFEVDVTEAIKAGGENVIVVCVANQRVDELGTGGLTAPALIYEPAKGMNAVLENVRPLRDTFP